jgi:hypothetical protein
MRLIYALAAVVATACSRGNGEAAEIPPTDQPRSAFQTLRGCSKPSSDAGLRYTDIVDGGDDLAGFLFEFRIRGDSIDAQFSEASGEIGRRRPVVHLRLGVATDSVAFALPNGTDSSQFVGRMNCDSLWGTFRAYRTSVGALATFRRVNADSVLRPRP